MGDPSRQRVEELFQGAVELDEQARENYLEEHCSDPEVRREVVALLHHFDAAQSDFLARLSACEEHDPDEDASELDAVFAAVISSPEPAVKLEELCRQHPGLSSCLRRRWRLAVEMGLERDGPAEQAPATHDFGDFRLLERLGGGGMGVVWLAEQKSLGRRVALKLIRTEFQSRRAKERFRREAIAISRLDHTGICPLFEAGEVDGTPFLAMRYLEGETLAERLAAERRGSTDRQQTPRLGSRGAQASGSGDARQSRVVRMARIHEKVARALHYAHEAGLVHRDVKPGNIMIGPADEPVLLDFGLARIEDGDTQTLTATGDVVGTPVYMAPEQIAPSRGRVDRRTDVYALGVSLYESLTLRVPFESASREQLYRRILAGDSQAARALDRRVPKDLSVVLKKAMDRNPARRYATAAEFAEDLRRAREHEPIHARRAGPVLRASRWVQRHPAASTAVTALSVAVFATSLGYVSARRAAEEANYRAYVSAVVAASAALTGHDTVTAERSLRAAPAEYRGFEWHHMWSSLDQSLLTRRYHRFAVTQVACAAGGSVVASASHDGTVRVFTAAEFCDPAVADAELTPVRVIGKHAGWVMSTSFGPDGKMIASSSLRGTLQLTDVASGEQTCLLPDNDRIVHAVAISPTGTHLASSGPRPAIWDLGDDRNRVELDGFGQVVYHLAFSPDGSLLATAEGHGKVGLWEVDTGRRVAELSGHIGSVNSVTFDSTGRLVASTAMDKTVRIWDVAQRRLLHVLIAHDGPTRCAAFGADDAILATSGDDTTIRVFRVRDWQQVNLLAGHRNRVNSLVFDDQHHRLISASQDGTLKVWSVEDTDPVAHLFTGAGAHTGYWCEFDPTGTLLAAAIGGADDLQLVSLWDPESLAALGSVDADTGYVESLAFRPDGMRIATAAHAEALRIWDPFTGQNTGTFASHSPKITCVSYHPDGRRVAAGGASEIRVTDVEEGCVVARIPYPNGRPEAVQFSADGRSLAASGRDGMLHVFDAASFELRYPPLAIDPADPKGYVIYDLRFSPDSRWVAGAAGDLWGSKPGLAMVWAVATGELVATLEGHGNRVSSVAFSPDGSRLATASFDETIRIWETRTFSELHEIVCPARLESVAFSADGRRLAAMTRNPPELLVFGSRSRSERETWLQTQRPERNAAEALVQRLLAENLELVEVADRIRRDSSLDPRQRRQALAAALRAANR